MKDYKSRLFDMIEHIEDFTNPDNIPVREDILKKFMNISDEEELGRISSSLQQMFRHLRRNCSWFYED